MNKTYLIKQLEDMQNAKRANREHVACLVLEHFELMPYLIEIVFEVENKLSIKAAWTLEIVCEKNLNLIIPYLDIFTATISSLKYDSAVRPAAKICNFMAIAFTSKHKNAIKNHFTKKHINLVIETGFDWMLSKHKVATKAYTMNALYLLGKHIDWVHEELQLILQQNISRESAAYKARGKITLALINKK